jgi:hypothetical protein
MTKNIPHFRAVIVITSLVVSGLGASADDYDYDRDIAPLLEQHCVQCHGPEKQKSRYRLDSFEALMTPGSSDEDPIVPHYPMQSPLMEYLLMPKSDEYAMPPEDEDPLSIREHPARQPSAPAFPSVSYSLQNNYWPLSTYESGEPSFTNKAQTEPVCSPTSNT